MISMPKLMTLTLYQYFCKDSMPTEAFAHAVGLIHALEAAALCSIIFIPMLLKVQMSSIGAKDWNAIDQGLASWGEKHAPIVLSVAPEEELEADGKSGLVAMDGPIDCKEIFPVSLSSPSFLSPSMRS
jgi:hypothetical protein